MEEKFGKSRNPFILVNNAGSKLTDLTFNLYHVIQDEMGQNLKSCFSYWWRGIPKTVKDR